MIELTRSDLNLEDGEEIAVVRTDVGLAKSIRSITADDSVSAEILHD